jgi:heat shock protein HtpX
MAYLRAGSLLLAMVALFVAIGSLFGTEGAAWALALATVIGFWSFWQSGPAVLRASGAREITVEEDRDLLNMVSKLAAKAGIPMPHVFEVEAGQANAFAVGANPQQASVVLTDGLRSLLYGPELEAIIAHEIGHIKTRDTLAATIGVSFLSAIVSIALILGFFGLALRKNGGGVLIALAIFFPFTALILHLAASRSREYAADRYGATLTTPRAMISALRYLQTEGEQPNQIAMHAPATASIWFIDPLAGTWLHAIFSTHPEIPKRIARLERLQPKREQKK